MRLLAGTCRPGAARAVHGREVIPRPGCRPGPRRPRRRRAARHQRRVARRPRARCRLGGGRGHGDDGHRHRRAPRHRCGARRPGAPRDGAGAVIEELYAALVEPTTLQPTFYVDFPRETSPLTRPHRRERRSRGTLGPRRGRDGDRHGIQRADGPPRPAEPADRAVAQGRRRRPGGDGGRRGLPPGPGDRHAAERRSRARGRPARHAAHQTPIRSVLTFPFTRSAPGAPAPRARSRRPAREAGEPWVATPTAAPREASPAWS